MPPRLLLLGARGFLGSSVARHIAEQHGAAELVLHARRIDGSDEPIGSTDGPQWLGLDLERADTRSFTELIDEAAPSVIVNCVGRTVGTPAELRSANVDVVVRLIETLEGRTGVHLVHLGSASEYGTQPRGVPVHEEVFAAPCTAHGVTKLEATELLIEAAAQRRITATVLRVFHPLGPRSPSNTLVGQAARAIDAALRSGLETVRLGPLGGCSDYIDTRDVARAVCSASSMAPRAGCILNGGTGIALQHVELVSKLAMIAGFRGEIVDDRVAVDRSRPDAWECADVDAIRRRLDWHAVHTVEDALGELWAATHELSRS